MAQMGSGVVSRSPAGEHAEHGEQKVSSFVTSRSPDHRAIVGGVKPARKREARGSARAKLAGAVRVTLRTTPDARIEARLHELSTTGGLIHLNEPMPEGQSVMVLFETPNGLVKETAEMLAPHWATKGCLQPFRFTDPAERNQRRLRQTLEYLLTKKNGRS